MSIVNMRDVSFKGSTLDVGNDNYGIIYNILKNEDDEICVDYYVEGEHDNIDNTYDNGVLFFSLSSFSSKNEREEIIRDVWKKLKLGGSLYIWDREKNSKEIIDEKITVLMPKGKEKEFQFKNNSIFAEFKIFNFQKSLEKYFEIQEGGIYDKIIYIKAIKRGSVKDESFTNSSKFKVHSQQSSSEILKSIYKGLGISRRN